MKRLKSVYNRCRSVYNSLHERTKDPDMTALPSLAATILIPEDVHLIRARDLTPEFEWAYAWKNPSDPKTTWHTIDPGEPRYSENREYAWEEVAEPGDMIWIRQIRQPPIRVGDIVTFGGDPTREYAVLSKCTVGNGTEWLWCAGETGRPFTALTKQATRVKAFDG